jgi:hypothetical protein
MEAYMHEIKRVYIHRDMSYAHAAMMCESNENNQEHACGTRVCICVTYIPEENTSGIGKNGR